MSVHGRSFLQYWCREFNYTTGAYGAHGWKDLDGGDLNRVEYEDSIYSPARLHVVISNRDMNQKLSSDSDTSAGMYTVEGEVSYPTFQRFQPIRLFHTPKPLYTKAITHNGGATAGGEITFTLNGHGFAVEDAVNLINESTGEMTDGVYKVKSVTTNTFKVYKRNTSINRWIHNVTGNGTSGTLVLHSEIKYSMYPLFYGRIDSVDVSYNDNVGKTISIVALDYLAGVKDEIITASRIGAPDRSSYDDAFGDTTLKDGTEDGQFKPVSYPAAGSTASHKLSATVKSMVSDWSYGREIFTDNTYDGTNSMGEGKFENSSFEFHGNDDGKFRHFAGRETTVLNAMKNVAMTERHAAATDAVGGAGVPVATSIKYVAAESVDYTSLVTTGTNRDVVFQKADHGYEDGNMVTVSGDTMPVGTDHIDFASWVVTGASDGYFKIKDMGGNVKQIADAATGSPPTLTRVAKISPAVTGSFGYDFFVDAGLYASTILLADQVKAHRPHLNYFLRGSRPADPQANGLTLQYPSQGDESEETFGWGQATSSGRINTTKMFLLPSFEHGLHAEDLYSHIGLASVGSDDEEPTDINDLGHKMELLKVNSISAEDWVAALPSSTEAERRIQRAYSGQWGKFHWDRSDSATGLGNYAAGAGDTDNQDYFRAGDGAHLSDGTYGVLTTGKGGDGTSNTTCTGLAGLSVLPTNGRSFTFPPDKPSNYNGLTGTRSIDAGDPAHTTTEVLVGGEALAAADLIKDVWNVDNEGLLGSEVTCTSNQTGTLIVESSAHGLETGNIIKITQFGTATSGNVGNIVVNTSPTRANADAPTTATGSYYRVQRKDVDEFYITNVQKHSTQLTQLAVGATAASDAFKYKLAYNVFKHACRIQSVTGDTFATGTKDTVLRTTETKADADYALISDVKKTDKPYPSINVNNLVVPNAASGGSHPTANLVTFATEYGSLSATTGLGYGTVPHTGTDGVLINRFQESGDNVKVKFLPGDYLSETRFLYHDDDLGGLVGRRLIGPGGEHTSLDLFISKNLQILERMVDSKSISKTYQLKYNESASSKNSIRTAAVQLLKRAILPSKRTTCKVFGYPLIKLTGVAQTGTGFAGGNPSASADEDFLVPVDNPIAYGGRAGMLVEKTTGLDGPPVDMVLPDTITSAGVKGEMLRGETWEVGDHYRMFIHLRAGNSVRVQHPAAGVIGNHIITRLTYYERMGTTETTIETTGYDEAAIKRQGQLTMLLETIKTAGSNLKPEYITVKKLSKDPFSPGP